MPVIGKSGTLAQGATPIVIWWDYNALSGRDTLNGNPPLEVVVPGNGVVAGVYVQAISAFAPQPNAAKLWMEYLYSDEGQLKWLEGYCHPIRFNDLVAKRQGAAGAARPAAAGAGLRERRLPDAPGAGGDEGSRHRRLGQRRRRQRAVIPRGAPATARGSATDRRAMTAPAPRTARSWAWLGIVPFLAFALLFLILPTMQIVVGAFRNPEGQFTLQNVANLFTPSILVGLLDLDPHQLRLGLPRLRHRLLRRLGGDARATCRAGCAGR